MTLRCVQASKLKRFRPVSQLSLSSRRGRKHPALVKRGDVNHGVVRKRC